MGVAAGRQGYGLPVAVREADATEQRVWRRARVSSSLARSAWWAKEAFWVIASAADRGQSDRSEMRRTAPTSTVCPATMLPAAGDGAPRDRLRARWPRIRGSLSLTFDGLLWQPDESGGRGLLMKDDDVATLVTGLSAHGIIVHLRDGSLGFMLSGNTRDEFVLQLAARCSRRA
jgi:hypothetical protein